MEFWSSEPGGTLTMSHLGGLLWWPHMLIFPTLSICMLCLWKTTYLYPHEIYTSNCVTFYHGWKKVTIILYYQGAPHLSSLSKWSGSRWQIGQDHVDASTWIGRNLSNKNTPTVIIVLPTGECSITYLNVGTPHCVLSVWWDTLASTVNVCLSSGLLTLAIIG